MKVAFIIRSTLFTVPGGDTVQVKQTAKELEKLGVSIDILSTTARVNYDDYDLFHFFNINRPADILFHIKRIKVPFFISPIFFDFSEYDKKHRKGFPGFVLRQFSGLQNEYIKSIARWVRGKDRLQSKSYVWKGQYKSMKQVLEKATAILPNSEAEYKDLEKMFLSKKNYAVVPNGIDTSLFVCDEKIKKDDNLIICAARIEGIKNQLNLIQALNGTEFKLVLIGSAAPNQKQYYETCKRMASENILFEQHMPQETLIQYYKKAKVHILPSWFETCGLSSLEAAAMGCQVVITEKGYTKDYFGNNAFYCEPGNTASILKAIREASKSNCKALQEKVTNEFTWEKAAGTTLLAYKKYMSEK